MPSRQLSPPSPSPAAAVVLAEFGYHRVRHAPTVAAAAGSAAAVALILVAAVVALLLWRRRRKLASAGGTGAVQPASALRRLSYQQLRRATGGFAAASKLGQGGFGPVFRGALPRSGQPVAVKVMDAAGSLQGEREFHNELALASHLLGCAAPAHGAIHLPFAYSLSTQPRRRRMTLVYELMPNGSLQDALLGKRCPEMVADWPRRLAVARDVAAALHYLHSVVQPPVIHGDVKPSNVLLDGEFRAHLSDFGLARIRSEEEDDQLESGPIGADGNGNDNPGGGCDDDVSVAGDSTSAIVVNGEDSAAKSPDDDDAFTTASPAEVASTSGCDKTSVGSGFNSRSCNGGGAAASGTGSDWWWRQDNGAGNSGVKDYVMEWIRSEIKKERPKNDWIAGASTAAPSTSSERKKPKRRAREWWREEYAEELTKKQKRRALAKSKSDAGAVSGLQWWERDCDLEEKGRSRWRMMKSWSRRSNNGNGSIGWWVDGVRGSRDWTSGEFVPKSGGAVSSTPSMRGTVCYVAPEYGGGGPLSEKCDIYSFGVLLLVLISGRRPLQMTTSPMSEFEKASLISWTRHLAQVGRLLHLVDPALQDVNREQALLCITVALLCIQRSPARRPSSTEVFEMLAGEAEPPPLPLEFSPSPPGGFPFKSRKKGR
jgi:serine/threonine protein kinase